MSITLRRVKDKDLKILYQWANDSEVRKNAFNQSTISFEEHINWFKKKRSSGKSKMFILEKDQEPVGQIRFDFDGGAWVITYSIEDRFRGMGLGKEIVYQGIRLMEGRIHAWVKKDNIASQKTFEKLGFTVIEENTEALLYNINK